LKPGPVEEAVAAYDESIAIRRELVEIEHRHAQRASRIDPVMALRYE
jgi:hypothetical protein